MTLRSFIAQVSSLLFIILTIPACSSSKKIVRLPQIAIEKVLDSLSQNQITFSHFQGKARVKLNGEEVKMGGRSDILMRKDSVVMMTFKKLGVEGARVFVRPDSSWVLYRMENVYEVIRTEDFLAYHKIFMSYSEVQNLLVGNIFVPEEKSIRSFSVGEFYNFEFVYGSNHYRYTLNDDFTIHEIYIKDTFDREIYVQMDDYNDRKFATQKKIEVDLPEEETVKLSLKYSKVIFDKAKEIKFEIPSHYTRLP